MTRLYFSPEAVSDLESVHDFIAEDSISSARRFIDLIKSNCKLLSGLPGIGKHRIEIAPDIRSFPVGNYVIFYFLLKDRIEISRILHSSRDIPSLFD